MRSVLDMIDCLNAPIAPGGDPDGFHLVDLDDHDCRFPTSQDRHGIRFCAMPAGDVTDSYCAFHRGYLQGQPASRHDEREAV
jgi:hypothetical protein